MNRPTVVIRVGWSTIEEYVSVQTHRSTGMTVDGATVVLLTDGLRSPGVAYCGEASIVAEIDGELRPLFTGLVDRVDLQSDGSAHVTLAGLKRDLETSLIGGLVVGDGCDPKEIIFALARQGGVPAHRINIQGWNPGPAKGSWLPLPSSASRSARISKSVTSS